MILVVDNYDSFTYNLVQYLGQCGADVVVRRNDAIDPEEIARLKPDGIMLSPAPAPPRVRRLPRRAEPRPLAGTGRVRGPRVRCLPGPPGDRHGRGGEVRQARNIMHGKASMVSHDGKGLFAGMPNPFSAIRYHSLIVTKESLPKGFVVTATADDDGEIMGLRHETLPIEGVQFHPESVLTQDGIRIVENFVRMVGKR